MEGRSTQGCIACDSTPVRTSRVRGSARSIRRYWSRSRRPQERRTTTCRCCSVRSAIRRTGGVDRTVVVESSIMVRKRVASGSLTAADLKPVHATLRATNAAIAAAYPGESVSRQPVHTVYGGAHLFRSDTASKLGALAPSALDDYAPDGATLAQALDLASAAGDAPGLPDTIRERVVNKLRREPVEDFRLDFEDGYGNRPDPEEDDHARSAAEE